MSETISAIASLLWPLIVLAVLVLFRVPLSRLIRSTESRDFTIKIAGQEVSVGELHRQQVDMVCDLQDQIAALHKDIAGTSSRTSVAKTSQDSPVPVAARTGGSVPMSLPTSAPATPGPGSSTGADFDETDTELTHVPVPAPERVHLHTDLVKAPWERLDIHLHEPETAEQQQESTPLSVPTAATGHDTGPGRTGDLPDTRPKPAGVLWVDDHPERNALQVDHLERRGVVVDTVRSTKEALQKLTGQRYQLIVSDMERVEAGKPVPTAGLELIRTVRTFDRDTPVVIFATGHGNKVLGDTAAQIGADMVTSSWYELNQELRRVGVLG